MLKPSDCKPGVEVVCIKHSIGGMDIHNLSVGSIYTIEKFSDFIWVYDEKKKIPAISLMEVAPTPNGNRCGYSIKIFKLRDPFELDKLFNLDNIDKELLRENYFDLIAD